MQRERVYAPLIASKTPKDGSFQRMRIPPKSLQHLMEDQPTFLEFQSDLMNLLLIEDYLVSWKINVAGLSLQIIKSSIINALFFQDPKPKKII